MDEFARFGKGLTSPASAGEAIAPSDVAPLAYATRGIYVGGSGDLTLRLVDGMTVTLVGVQGGTFYPLRAEQVMATGTTATNLVGLR